MAPTIRRGRTRDLWHADPREYAHFLSTAAWCAYLRNDTALSFVEEEVRRVAGHDPGIGLWADLLTGAALLSDHRPRSALAHAEELADRAATRGYLAVAWLTSSLAAASALLLRDLVTSSTWMERGVGYQRQSGNARDVGLLEFRGNLEAMAGRYETAAQLFGQSSTLAFREGSPWPQRRWTSESLARVREGLTVDRFETRWKHGVAAASTTGDAARPSLRWSRIGPGDGTFETAAPAPTRSVLREDQ